MNIKQVRWFTLNKFDIRFQIRYGHATVCWYTLSYGKVVIQLYTVLYV